MPTVERQTVVTPTSTNNGPGTALAILVGIIVVAVIGYMIYAYGRPGTAPNVIERNNTTIKQPVPVPTPSPAPSTNANSTPDTNSSNPSTPSSDQ